MKLKYINRIKANISIYSKLITSNILEGTYKSVYKGKSLNFENLREYVVNDDVKDIDWKASSRSGTLLVKQFIAEKKHNIMFVMDTGKKMSGNTNSNNIKKDIALYSAGTIGYLAIKNGDYVGMIYNMNDSITYKPFKYNLYNLEEYLSIYDKISILENKFGIEETLKYLYRNLKKKMIIFIITDMNGIKTIDNKLLKNLNTIHDVLLINIDDGYMTGNEVFDLESNEYIPNIVLNDKNLHKLELELRNKIKKENEQKLKKNKIAFVSIDNVEEIYIKIIELLERHKYASNN